MRRIKSIKIDLKMTEMMELTNKGVKTALVSMLHMFEMIQENMSIIRREITNVK